MQKTLKFWTLLLTGVFGVVWMCPAPIVWRPGEGLEEEGGNTAGSAKETLELAKKLENEKQFSDALKVYRAGSRKFPYSFSAPELQYGWGRMQEIEGDFGPAFKTYSTIVEKYPNSTYFDLALERQFGIANLFLAGERQKIWKIPTLPSMDKTVEYFEKIVKSAPYSKWAAESQFKIGVAREKQKKWTDAVEAYQNILQKYPGSDLAPLSQYQIGYAWYLASSEPEYDQSAAEKSVEAFTDFMTRFPRHEKVAQAQEHINFLRNRQNQGAFNIARFYDKQGDYKAALIYYNEVIEANPESPSAKQSARRIEELNRVVSAEDKAKGDKATPPPLINSAKIKTATSTPVGPQPPPDLPKP